MTQKLLIETSTKICSAGLYSEDRLTAHKIIHDESYVHAESLLPSIQDMLELSGTGDSAIDGVVVGAGPGSYTGLRIGTSLAKGICFGLGIPLYSIDSGQMFAALAKKNFPHQHRYVSVSDAGRMEAYIAIYDKDVNCLQSHNPVILDADFFRQDLLQEAVFVGDGIEKCRHLMLPGQSI